MKRIKRLLRALGLVGVLRRSACWVGLHDWWLVTRTPVADAHITLWSCQRCGVVRSTNTTQPGPWDLRGKREET